MSTATVSKHLVENEGCRLLQRGLYIEPLKRYINEQFSPQDGHEYIHQVRKEAKDLGLSFSDDEQNTGTHANRPGSETETETASELTDEEEVTDSDVESETDEADEDVLLTAVAKHLFLKGRLSSEKDDLIREFSPVYKVHKLNEKMWCNFALGTEHYNKLYGRSNLVRNNKDCGHPPLLSIILHLSQEKIFFLLELFLQWTEKIGFDNSIGQWIYALLVCVEVPMRADFTEILQKGLEYFKKAQKGGMPDYKLQMHLFTRLFSYSLD